MLKKKKKLLSHLMYISCFWPFGFVLFPPQIVEPLIQFYIAQSRYMMTIKLANLFNPFIGTSLFLTTPPPVRKHKKT